MIPSARSSWQKVRKPLVIVGMVALLVGVVVLIFVAVQLYGTGFNGYYKVSTARTISGTSSGTVIRTEEYQPGKTLWDWLQLLIIPVVLAIGGYFFTFTISRNEQRAADRHNQTERQIALDKQREDLLQAYLDRMSELLLKEQLRSSASDAEVRNVARLRTITTLCQLDARRIGYVFAFLREAGLMSNKPNSSVVILSEADLRMVNWSQADLYQANLSRTNLSGTDLSKANLSEARLKGANLSRAELSRANLSRANLSFAGLSGADLSEAYLSRADLSEAYLSGANLSKAYLSGANLSKAYLSGANLSEADLSDADLSDADLDQALQLHLFGGSWPWSQFEA